VPEKSLNNRKEVGHTLCQSEFPGKGVTSCSEPGIVKSRGGERKRRMFNSQDSTGPIKGIQEDPWMRSTRGESHKIRGRTLQGSTKGEEREGRDWGAEEGGCRPRSRELAEVRGELKGP